MKTKILTTVAAALIASVAGLTLATGASAYHGPPKKLKLSGLCTSVNGGLINSPETRHQSGPLIVFCVRHTVATNHSQLPFHAGVRVRFTKFGGTMQTQANIKKCTKSVLTVSFYKRKLPGKWQLVQRLKVNAVKKFKYCVAYAITKYASGATMYRTVVRMVDGDGKNTGNIIWSQIMSGI